MLCASLVGNELALIVLVSCAIALYIRKLRKKKGKIMGHWKEYFGYKNFVWRWKDIRERVSNLEGEVQELQDKVLRLEKERDAVK